MMMKTDKSVRAMWGMLFDPRIEMRGYPGFLIPHVETWGYSNLVDNRIQLNLPIYRWGITSLFYNPLSVSTDYIIPQVEMWGYPEHVNDRIESNPLIYQWDNTAYTHKLLSVSTDYCLR